MTPLGYIAKRIAQRPDWLDVPHVWDICSVANCISEDFADYINYWRHNGYWLFDHPEVISDICNENAIDTSGLRFFYLESDLTQYDPDRTLWVDFEPVASFSTCVKKAHESQLLGYDVVTIYCCDAPEHSPLSCNHLASQLPVNKHCLIDSLDDARDYIVRGAFANSEPGLLRIVAVHEIKNRDEPSDAPKSRNRAV